MIESPHRPVMLREVLELLDPQPGETVVDLTAGLGGHAAALASRVGPTGAVALFDLDPGNLVQARERVATTGVRVVAHHANFADAPARLAAAGWSADVVLADLGFASPQVDDPQRGFSFKADGPLDMRLDPSASFTAADLVNEASEAELSRIFFEYGEEPLARKIARRIVAERAQGPIQTTSRLVDIVRAAYGPRARRSRMDPATKTFMALRIAVNDELGSLERLCDRIGLAAASLEENPARAEWLRPGARIVVISFHSLEDRIVKHAFRSLADRGLARRLTKKPLKATEDETKLNPRARSAKLRAIRLSVGTE